MIMRKKLFKPIVIGALVLAAVGCVIAAAAFLDNPWWPRAEEKAAATAETKGSVELVGESTLRLSSRAAEAMGITTETITRAAVPTKPRPLPPQVGTLAYDSERLFAVTSRFAGEVFKVMDAPADQQSASVQIQPDFPRYPKSEDVLNPSKVKPRPFAVGDRVKKGQLLAIVWSKDLGDKKAALIDGLIDLRRDRIRQEDIDNLYYQGAVSMASKLDAQRTVQKDLNAVNAAERVLRMWKLDDQEIDAVYKEAKTIEESKRDPKKEMNWARVEVRAPSDGTIVEKNTHRTGWVDPANYTTPMFRIADLSELAVWLNPAEEYLPVIQSFLKTPAAVPLAWQIRLQADSKAPPMSGSIVRIAPSLDPNDHRVLVVGLVKNPGGKLLVGQFVTATIFVPLEDHLVEIPTTALNEDRGQSVVFVQADPKKLEFSLRRVAVVHRFKDVVYVRSKLTGKEKEVNESLTPKDFHSGIRPIEILEPGDLVVTESVVEMTKALRDLEAKEEMAKIKKAKSPN